MNIHEYQAKGLLKKYGIGVPDGNVAFTSNEAVAVANELDCDAWVIKAQIHAGGRGKAGGVKLVQSIEDVAKESEKMLGMKLVTHQTGPSGKIVNKIYIEKKSDVAREMYLGLLIDRSTENVTVLASTEGGMDIEDIAEKTPEKIFKIGINPLSGMQPFYARRVAAALGLSGKQINKCVKLLQGMYKAFLDLDCSTIEINPLVLTKQEDLLALDAKMSFDGNALYRHPELASLRDESEEEPTEVEAAKHNLSYVKLGGNIGCMVNGAGLAMATKDIVKLYGGNAANFLDVKGSASKERITAAFKIIASDPNVKGILVNIFGGITRCNLIAEGIIEAVHEIGLQVPLVVRLEGTNADLGKKLLSESGLAIIPADGLDHAAQTIVKVVQDAEKTSASMKKGTKYVGPRQ